MKDMKQKQISRERSDWCNGDCEWKASDGLGVPVHLGCYEKVESGCKHANFDVFCSVLLTNFSPPSSKHLKFLP